MGLGRPPRNDVHARRVRLRDREPALNVDPGCRLLARGPFLPGEVTTRLVGEPRPTTPELDIHIERAWHAALAKAEESGQHLFDGDVLRWVRAIVHGADEGRRLELIVAPGKYREFVGTNLDPVLRPDFGPRRASDLPTSVHPWSHFANSVGTSAVVVTTDGVVVAGRRSARVLGYAGCVHAFGGMLEAADAAGDGAKIGAVDVFGGLARELVEELGVRAEEISEPVLEGVILEPEIWQPEMIFHAKVARSFAGLVDAWSGAVHRDEHDELITFPLVPDDPEAELRREAPVSPIGRAALALYWSRRGG
jgi:8-oxo-dGTP pyrophosphatase MutT (NUDIX family)